MLAQAQLYARGKYRLELDIRSDGRPRTTNYQIVWYDPDARRNRYKSTGTSTLWEAEDALDRFYSLKERGITICPCCQRPLTQVEKYSVEQGITDYLVAKSDKSSFIEIRSRLSHFLDFLEARKLENLDCNAISEELITTFRKWSGEVPVIIGKPESGNTRDRSPSTTEATVRQLKAVVNFAFKKEQIQSPARFSPLSPKDVDRTPHFRASIEDLRNMFRYCLEPTTPTDWKREMTAKEIAHAKRQRLPLLRFLQISVATWCRPDAAHDFSTRRERDQWVKDAAALNLNPKGRVQTKKRRPTVPAPRQLIPLLAATDGPFVGVESVYQAYQKMVREIGIAEDRQSGLKLIRRSIAQLVRDRIGEHRWRQGQIMLGHTKASTSDIYALSKPAHLGLALRHTEAIIDEIESAVPGAFTGVAPETQPEKEP